MPKPSLTRDQSLEAKPIAAPIVARKDLAGGGERITVEFEPSGFRKKFLRMPDRIRRHFELDVLGLEVLSMCDGQKTVRYIVERFAKAHKLDSHEAERAVLEFLRMLIRKGLVAVVVRKNS